MKLPSASGERRLICGCVDVLVAMDRITAYSCTIQTIFQLLAHLFAVAEDHGPIFPATFLRDILGGMSQHSKLSHSQKPNRNIPKTFKTHPVLIVSLPDIPASSKYGYFWSFVVPAETSGFSSVLRNNKLVLKRYTYRVLGNVSCLNMSEYLCLTNSCVFR